MLAEHAPTPRDWALFAGQTVIGSASFALIHLALKTAPPAMVTAGRLWVGALVMYGAMRFGGRQYPPLFVSSGRGLALHRAWGWMIAVGAVGYAIPFSIFPWAQQFIASGLAGVYMAFMPIWTLALAVMFVGERLTPRKLIGFGLGSFGVLILLGPEVFSGVARSSVLAQFGLLIATFCYAGSAVLSRKGPRLRPRVFAAGTTLAGALLTTPALLFAGIHPAAISPASALAIIGLGVGPTGLAGLLIVILIKRVGASFMALANYLTPVLAVALGALLYRERLDPQVFPALIIILVGVAVAQGRSRRALRPQTSIAPAETGTAPPPTATLTTAPASASTSTMICDGRPSS